MFSAADEEQWKLIARQIDQSDYYIVLIAHRYGSMTEGLSYTEKEYEYAVSKGVPALGFVIKDGAKWPSDRIDKDRKKSKKLESFKTKVKAKLVDFWSSGDELRGKVAIALMKAANTTPRPGWVRANAAAGPEVLAEISRLSSENATLRSQLHSAQDRKNQERIAKLQDNLTLIEKAHTTIQIWILGASTWSAPQQTTLLIILDTIASELIVEASLERLAEVLANRFKPHDAKLRATWPTPTNMVRSFMIKLQSVELVCPSTKKHPLADTSEYWKLTTDGQLLLNYAHRLALERAQKTDADAA